jgi:hypothetical protein
MQHQQLHIDHGANNPPLPLPDQIIKDDATGNTLSLSQQRYRYTTIHAANPSPSHQTTTQTTTAPKTSSATATIPPHSTGKEPLRHPQHPHHSNTPGD